ILAGPIESVVERGKDDAVLIWHALLIINARKELGRLADLKFFRIEWLHAWQNPRTGLLLNYLILYGIKSLTLSKEPSGSESRNFILSCTIYQYDAPATPDL